MNPLIIATAYVSWHYGKAFSDIFHVGGNFLWFILHFFSMKDLILNLFSPWKRLHEEYKRGLDLGEIFGTILVNILMRIVGAIVRILFIIIGTITFTVGLVLGISFLILWILAPMVILASVFSWLGIVFV